MIVLHAKRNSAVSGWTKIADGDLWRWKWGEWTSPAFPYLEERPWTPIVVAGRLCFAAHREDLGWCVVWGDEIGRWYDDVYDIAEVRGAPIYIARDGADFFLVWDGRESQRFRTARDRIKARLDILKGLTDQELAAKPAD